MAEERVLIGLVSVICNGRNAAKIDQRDVVVVLIHDDSDVAGRIDGDGPRIIADRDRLNELLRAEVEDAGEAGKIIDGEADIRERIHGRGKLRLLIGDRSHGLIEHAEGRHGGGFAGSVKKAW